MTDTQQQDQVGRRSAVAYTVTGAVTHGGLIQLTAAGHPFQTGDKIRVQSVGGTVEANGKWDVTRISASTFDLIGSTFTNAYTSGGNARHAQN